MNEDYDFDIIFVNGLSGGVFHTWRQHDSVLLEADTDEKVKKYTKCWPRVSIL